jgi:ribosome recycling factor
MGVVYSMYDALVSINVPTEKAKAVINAMERDMMDKIATKSDVENLRLATKTDVENLRLATKADVENLRLASKADLEHVREILSRDMQAMRADMAYKIEKLESRLVIRLGQMMAASLVLTCTILGTLQALH